MGTEKYWDLREAHGNIQRGRSSQNPGRSHSDTSGLDYRKTIEWLRELLGYPESRSPELTRLPSRLKTFNEPPQEKRQISDSLLPRAQNARTSTRKCTHSGRSSSRINGPGFQRVVSDLEGLLNEAVALASQVVQPDSSATEGENKLPVPATEHEERGSRRSRTPENVEDQAETDCVDVANAPRPKVPHAATFSAGPRRPRLQDIVKKSSGNDENLMTTNSVAPLRPATTPRKYAEEVRISIPQRKSSRATLRPSAPPKVLKKKQSRKHYKDQPRVDHLPCDEKELVDFDADENTPARLPVERSAFNQHVPYRNIVEGDLPETAVAGRQMPHEHGISLRHRSHVSLPGAQDFSLPRSRKRQPIARDWSSFRKKIVASTACLSTALVGVLLGIYTGLVPRIQYYIVDESHATIYGNTGCFLGLAIPTFCFWPLPLLHGRKPYILSGLVLAMPLLFPQALSVLNQRLTHTEAWRAVLIASRTLMGGALGLASMNFHSTLTDLFGASLMSSNPHEEVVDECDARRHGGGMGAWLGIWTWCWIGSLGVGFLIGASIIDSQPPVWGFYVSIILIAIVLFLNVLCPEVRRSSYRRSVAEVRTGADISRRLARGEIKMHRIKTGPKWWGEEAYHGIALSLEMLRQPGFAVMAVYSAWIYAQVVLIIVLLGSLASNVYRLPSPKVGLCVGGVTLGALLAVPFQKANLFSRSRRSKVNSNRATLEKRMSWTAHLLRRAIFTILLPVAGCCYAAVSSGPPIHIAGPVIFAIFVGFLSSLAISECNGLIMETFDTSDLWPGMTGRQRGEAQKRTNYSSFPRVTAGYAIIHTLAFTFAAGATALGGYITRTLGHQVTTALVAGILFFFTVLLLLVIIRWKKVRIIPESKSEEMEKLMDARRKSTALLEATPDDPQAIEENDQAWRPTMMGNPVTKMRRMNLLELGNLSRWQEIRKRNKLIDEGKHPNREAFDQGLEALDEHFRSSAQDLLQRNHRSKSSRAFKRLSDGDDMGLNNWHGTTGGESTKRTPFGTPSGTPFMERDCFIGRAVQEEDENDGDIQQRR